jgi:hypothetical protein
MKLPTVRLAQRVKVGMHQASSHRSVLGAAHETEKIVRLEKMSIENKRLTGIKETQSSLGSKPLTADFSATTSFPFHDAWGG